MDRESAHQIAPAQPSPQNACSNRLALGLPLPNQIDTCGMVRDSCWLLQVEIRRITIVRLWRASSCIANRRFVSSLGLAAGGGDHRLHRIPSPIDHRRIVGGVATVFSLGASVPLSGGSRQPRIEASCMRHCGAIKGSTPASYRSKVYAALAADTTIPINPSSPRDPCATIVGSAPSWS